MTTDAGPGLRVCWMAWNKGLTHPERMENRGSMERKFSRFGREKILCERPIEE